MPDISYIVQKTAEQVPDKGIYKLTQAPFDFAHTILPEKLHNLPAEVMIEGFAWTYALTFGLQKASKCIDKVINDFDENIFPWFERACVIGIPAALVLYALIDQEGAQYWIDNKPMDNLGISMAYLGGLARAVPDLNKKGGVIKPIVNLIKDALK